MKRLFKIMNTLLAGILLTLLVILSAGKSLLNSYSSTHEASQYRIPDLIDSTANNDSLLSESNWPNFERNYNAGAMSPAIVAESKRLNYAFNIRDVSVIVDFNSTSRPSLKSKKITCYINDVVLFENDPEKAFLIGHELAHNTDLENALQNYFELKVEIEGEEICTKELTSREVSYSDRLPLLLFIFDDKKCPTIRYL